MSALSHPPASKGHTAQPLESFALIGWLETAGHYAVFVSLVELADVGAVTASGWGALAGLLIYYLLNFGLSFRLHAEIFSRFAMIAGCWLGLNGLLMALLVKQFGLYYLSAQVLVTGIIVIVWLSIGNRLRTVQMDQGNLERMPPLGLVRREIWGHLLQLGPVLLGFILLVRFLTLGAYPVVDPSESRYAEMARKMVETQVWVTPQIDYGVPFWGKPPLAVWLNAIDVTLFGVNEFAVRLSAFLLCGGIVWVVYALGKTRVSKAEALAAPIMLAGMALFFVMAGSIAMDECLALGVTLALASFWQALQTKKSLFGYVFFVGLAIGLLSKGPITLILAGLPIFFWTLIRHQWREIWEHVPWIKGSLLMFALSVPWYLMAEHRTPGFLEYFLVGEHWKRFTEPGWQGDLYGSGRAHMRGTIWVYWLLAALPWSPVFLSVVGVALYRKEARSLIESQDGWRLYCLLWMLSPLVFFTASANIIWTYALPGLPGCALLLAEWRRDGRLVWFSNDRLIAGLGLLVPVLFLGAVIVWLITPLSFVRTQKLVVKQYYQLRQNESQKLVYLRGNPYSALFYTQGKSKALSNVEDFQRVLEGIGDDFYVCPRNNWPDLPDAIKSHLQIVGRYDGFLLAQQVPQVKSQ